MSKHRSFGNAFAYARLKQNLRRNHRYSSGSSGAMDTFFDLLIGIVIFPWMVMLFLPKKMPMDTKKTIATIVSILYYGAIVIAVVLYFSPSHNKSASRYVDPSVYYAVTDVNIWAQDYVDSANTPDYLSEMQGAMNNIQLFEVHDPVNDAILARDAQDVVKKYTKATNVPGNFTSMYDSLKTAVDKLNADVNKYELDPQS